MVLFQHQQSAMERMRIIGVLGSFRGGTHACRAGWEGFTLRLRGWLRGILEGLRHWTEDLDLRENVDKCHKVDCAHVVQRRFQEDNFELQGDVGGLGVAHALEHGFHILKLGFLLLGLQFEWEVGDAPLGRAPNEIRHVFVRRRVPSSVERLLDV